MMIVSRITKQAFILVIFLVLLAGAGFAVRQAIAPPPPTPTPDPRALLLPIQVLETHKITSGERDYDILVKVRNPNTEYGSGDVQYALSGFYDATGSNEGKEEVRIGSFSILPGQTQYLVFSPIRTIRETTRFELRIVTVDWQKLDPLAAEAVDFVVTNLAWTENKLAGNVYNTTDFDLTKAEVIGILFDSSDRPIAINRTDIRTFIAHTTRGFEMSWSSKFAGTPVREYAEAHVNVFENDNFIRAYGVPEERQ